MNNAGNIIRIFLLVFALFLFSGCAMTGGKVADGVKPMMADHELEGTELLDVDIMVFDSVELTEKEKEKFGLSEDIRRAEERFIPIHLMYTLQRTGYWGVVRVVPAESSAHVQVRGTILRSDGEHLALEIEALDSRGVQWFERKYSEAIKPADYSDITAGEKDPFQDLYNTIANDLAEYRKKFTTEDIREIQQVSDLRFARDMAPDVFAEYLSREKDGRYHLKRLPAEDDTMMKRVGAIQMRDNMLVDTVNDYYGIYYQDLWQPYGEWRKLYAEELAALKKLEKQALTRQLLGLAAIVGGVVAATQNNSVSRSGLPGVMVVGGAAAVYSGFQKRAETKIHKDAIEELSTSFSSEAAPLVVEVVGETVRLTGSAEEQYAEWRSLLRDIYTSETGLSLESGGVGRGADEDSTKEKLPSGL